MGCTVGFWVILRRNSPVHAFNFSLSLFIELKKLVKNPNWMEADQF